METGEQLKTQPYLIQQEYRNLVESFYQNLIKECRGMQIDFQNIMTNESFDKALLRYLIKRQKMV
jgi:hypothetical protein